MIKRAIKKLLSPRYKLYDANYIWSLREKALKSRGVSRYLYTRKYNKSILLAGASIPANVSFASAPVFPHGLFGIMISSGAVIGSGCTIFHQVTIGSNTLPNTKKPGAPIIGDNVYIGAGAKIIGGIRIGNNVRIGANCVIVNDIPDNSTVVLPAPRVITHDEVKDNAHRSWAEFKKG